MKYGICQWCLPIEGSACISKVAELGFDAIELGLSNDFETDPLRDPAVQQEYLALAKEYGIDLPTFGVNTFCKWGECHAENQEICQKIVAVAIEVAHGLGIKLLQVPSFGDGMITTKQELDTTVEFYKYFCTQAKAYGISVSCETALSAEGNLYLLEQVGMDNFKCFFDTQNPFVVHRFASDEIAIALKDYIVEAHAKDGFAGEMSNALLGQGESNYYKTIDALKAIGYDGYIHLENNYEEIIKRYPECSMDELIKKDLAILKASI